MGSTSSKRARRSTAGALTIALITALLSFVGAAPASAADLTEAEPNGTVATANPLPLGATMYGSTQGDTTRDDDYFAFELAEGGRVTFDLQFPDGLTGEYAYQFEVDDAAGKRVFMWAIRSADHDGAVLRDRATLLRAGQYVVRVSGAPTLAAWGAQYSLRVTSSPEFVEAEPNNSSSPTVLPLDTTIHGSMLYVSGDSDWYAVDIPQAGRATIDLRFPTGLTAGDAYDVMLFGAGAGGGSDGWTVDTTQADGAFLRGQATFVSPGRHYLIIEGDANRPTWGKEYTLSVSLTPGFVETEQNYVFSEADALPLGKTISGSALDGVADMDYFAIDMPKIGAAQIDFTFAAGLPDTQVYGLAVYAADESLVREFTITGSQADGTSLRSRPIPLPAGRSYIRVNGLREWPSWGGEYRLSASWVPTPQSTVTRLAGADRYQTSAAVSRASFAPGVPLAYVASGTDYPDALSGAPVAGKNGAPVLLVQASAIPSVVRAELQRLKPSRIVILGGVGAVGNGVQTQLKALATTGSVSRLAGADRYQTSVAISKASFSPGVAKVYLASGENFPDALSGAPAAGVNKSPLLLVRRDSIPSAVQAELTRLKPQEVIVLGGLGAVSYRATSQIPRQVGGGTITWYSGADRFDTSAWSSRSTFRTKVPVAYIANGLDFPDALSGAPVAAAQKGPILLTAVDKLPASVLEELKRLKPARIVVLGGTGAVSAKLESQLAQLAIP